MMVKPAVKKFRSLILPACITRPTWKKNVSFSFLELGNVLVNLSLYLYFDVIMALRVNASLEVDLSVKLTNDSVFKS